MNRKTITIESNTMKKGKLDRQSFTCQLFESGDKRVYVLDRTKRDLVRYHFTLTPGCRILDDGVTHVIKDIWYPPAPKYPHLIVIPKAV